MVAIPQYESKVGVSHTPTSYYRTSVNPDAFGAGIARATEKLGESSEFFIRSMANMHQQIQKTNAAVLSNYIDQLEREDLCDPQNGYYSKLGKDAMANPNDPNSGASGVLNSIDQKILKKQQELGLTWGYGKQLADIVKTKKLDMLYRGATNHELEETRKWGLATLEEAQNSAINKGILHRDNDEDLQTALGNGRAIVLNKAKVLRYDGDTTRIQLAKFTSDFHSGVLNAYLDDGSLKASEYYEKHKDELLPEAQARYLGQVKNNELNYTARSVSDRLYNLFPENEAAAFAEVDKIENEKERQAVENRLVAKYSQKKRLEDHAQDQLLDDMYSRIAEKMKNGQIPSEDDIPYGLNGRNWIAAQKAINDLANNGDIETDNEAYLELYELRNTDAQKFANMNLAPYRAYLSNSDYKAFQKAQVDIKNMTPTQLADQDTILKNGLKSLGYTYNKQGELETRQFLGNDSWGTTKANATAYKNALNAYIRELELKRGKNLTNAEMTDAMQEFTSSYAYSDRKGKTSTLYTEGMNKQVGFMRNLLNDFAAAEQAKGSALTDEEKHKIVAERVSKTVQEDNNVLSSNIRGAQVGDVWFGHMITSTYGRRTSPTRGASSDHKGIDLAYKNNEKFEAFAGGKVINVVNNHRSYGNYVDIQSADGTIHRYAHANSISVKKGQTVTAGMYIGRAGSTGISTGPHLHYERIVNGQAEDPFKHNTSNQGGWAF